MSLPRLAGLKQSGELSLLLPRGGLGPPFLALCRGLAQRRVNIVFLAHDRARERASLGLEPEDAPQALDLARQIALDHGLGPPELIGQITALTLFPLADNPALPLIAVGRLAEAGVAPLAMATSLAAVTLLIGHRHLATALEALTRAFHLPAGVSPPQARVKVVQSPLFRPTD